MDDLKKLIREIPDYPKPGILFYDLTTLLQDPAGFYTWWTGCAATTRASRWIVVAGIEADARIYFRAVAYRLGAGVCPGAQAEKAARGRRHQ